MRQFLAQVRVLALAVLVFGLLGACSDDSSPVGEDAGVDAAPLRPDAYIGPCQDDPVPVLHGDYQALVSSLQIGSYDEGFDLDYDGKPDNVMASFGSVLNGPLRDSFASGDIWIPLEFFGLEDVQNDDCVNMSVYYGRFAPDRDGDGEETEGKVGRTGDDCNDLDPNIGPAMDEVPGNRVDDDCDGMADETSDATPSEDATDLDGDGYSPADGDCDDRLPTDWPDAPERWDPAEINPGHLEVCGNGLDDNCDGRADEGCDPYVLASSADEVNEVVLDSLSLDDAGDEALIVFRSGRIVDGLFQAGPSKFVVSVEVDRRQTELTLTYAVVEGTLSIDAATNGLVIQDMRLGGVLSAQSLDLVPNPIGDMYGSEDNTLFDVIVGPAGLLLGLPTVGRCMLRPDQAGEEQPLPPEPCKTVADCSDPRTYCDREIRPPDIDVDGDGIEIFLDLNLDDNPDVFRVDTCIDGDGTVIQDKITYSETSCEDNRDCLDAMGPEWFCESKRKVCFKTEHCTQAKDENGNYRFVDGFSMLLKMEAVPVRFWGIFESQQ